MFVYVKNRFKGFSQVSFVYNEDGDKLFLIRGRMFYLSNRTDLCDMEGNKLFTIKNKVFPIFKNCVNVYSYTENKKKLFCKIKTKRGKYFKITNCDYALTLNGKIDEGMLIGFNDNDIAYFEEYDFDEKTFNSNSYELEIYEDEDLGGLDVATLSAIVIGADGLMLKLGDK